jgi:uncharacterized protein
MIELRKMSELTDLPEDILKEAAKVGVVDKERAGTYFQIDQKSIFSTVNKRFEGEIEMLDMKDALKKYDWLEEYYWKLIDPEKDEYTKAVRDDMQGGYFMRILENSQPTFPLQSCLMVSSGVTQKVHNIIIAEKGSNARIITGCTKHPQAAGGRHLGVSEIYIKEDATLNFTMIHDWSRDTIVRPRSAARVDSRGRFVSNYVLLNPVKDLQMYPVSFCEGDNSSASLNSLIVAKEDSKIDVGSRIVLRGRASRGEVISRTIAKDKAEAIIRGSLEGENSECKGHLECQSLILDDSFVHAIPELVARKEGAELSHEAAVGKIAEKELVYLMSRGLGEEEAVSLIMRGFLDVSILGLTEKLEQSVRELIDETIGAN